MISNQYHNLIITSIKAQDIRFPTSKTNEGTDSVHTNCNYSAAYVNLRVKNNDNIDEELPVGHGIIFTIGKGNDLCCQAVDHLSDILLGKSFGDVLDNFSEYWRKLTNEPQLRWCGPEKGVVHLSVAGIVNSIWDLYGKLEKKPLWKLLTDLPAEKLVNMLNFRYIEDALTKEEALQILKESENHRAEREKHIREKGFPAYTTACAWSGYSDEKVKRLCQEALDQGFRAFKVKTGMGLESDSNRLKLMREAVGPDCILMVDSNQIWTVKEAIDTMTQLAKYNLYFIEEPTSPDDALGHAEIAKAMKLLGIRVATGEHLQNRIMHKHFNILGGYDTCQLDSARLGGVNEAIIVLLMAKKFGKPVCFHTGGVGLCEMGIHLQMFDYIGIQGSEEDRWCEYAGALHEHFVDPVHIKDGRYVAPNAYGYAADLKEQSIHDYSYPDGPIWRQELSGNNVKIQNQISSNQKASFSVIFTPFSGIMAATLTPYTDETCLEINYDLIPQYAKCLVSQGVTGIFLNGTSGESFSLTSGEKKRILEHWMKTEEVKNKSLYVIVHSTCTSFPDTVDVCQHARSQGVDGVAIMAPSYFRPQNQYHLAEILADVAKQVSDVPFYYYHFPGMNEVNYQVRKTLDIAHSLSPNVVGCKYTGNDCSDIGLIVQRGYTALIGYDTSLLSAFCAGAQGAIGLTFNIFGNIHRAIYDNFHSNNIKEAANKQSISRQVIKALQGNSVLPQVIKGLMNNWYGLDFGPLRWPQRNLSKQEYNGCVKELDKLKIEYDVKKVEQEINGKASKSKKGGINKQSTEKGTETPQKQSQETPEQESGSKRKSTRVQSKHEPPVQKKVQI